MKKISRSDFIFSTTVAAAAFACDPIQALSFNQKTDQNMYGLIGKITAKDGQRNALIKILLEGITDLPGCLSYIVSKDLEDDNAIWVTEVWDSKESHQASLSLPSVKKAISKGRPLIAEFGRQTEIKPVGGHGLVPVK